MRIISVKQKTNKNKLYIGKSKTIPVIKAKIYLSPNDALIKENRHHR